MQETTSFVTALNHYLSLASIVGAVVLIFWMLYLAKEMYGKKISHLTNKVSEYVLPLGFLITTAGMLMSLYYSEFLKIVPCDLCWFQRIFMYPQAFLFAYAWYKKDRNILPYSLVLSGVGFVIAGYHHMLQIGYDMYKPCSTSPFAVDCAKPTFVEFGFVTFPFMALVLFGALILLVITATHFAKRIVRV
jgi:disulfide bond formation protein DsbB